MNEIDRTNTPPPITTVDAGQPPPTDGTVAPGAPLPYDTSGAPSPKVHKNDAPPLNHTPDGDFDISSAVNLSQKFVGSVEYDVFAAMDLMEKSMTENQKLAEDETVQAILDTAAKFKEGAEAMRKAAQFALGAGLAMGIMQVTGGVVATGGAVASTKMLSGSESAETGAMDAAESEIEPNKPEEEEIEASSSTGATSEAPESGQTQSAGEEDNISDEIKAQERKLQKVAQEVNDVQPGDNEVQSTDSPNEADRENTVDEEQVTKKKLRAKAKGGGNLIAYQKAQNISTFTQGLSQVIQGTGQVLSTILKYYGDEKQAEAKEIEAQASQRQSFQQEKKAYAESVMNDAEKIFDQMQQLMQSSNTTSEAIATRI